MAQDVKEDFYFLTASISRRLREANLTAAEYKLWLYLVEHSPKGDEFVDLDVSKVIADCGISKATFSRAKNKFQELELFEFQKRRTVINFLMEEE